MKKIIYLITFLLILISCANNVNNDKLTRSQRKVEISRIKTQMAIEFIKNNDYRNAIKSINEAILLNDNYDIAWVTRALIYQNLNILDEADKSYKRAISLNPKSSETLNNYGWFLCSIKNNFPDSIKYFKLALEDPTYPTPYLALMNKGICEAKLGNFSIAENDLIRSRSMSPNWFKEPIKELAKIKYNQSDFVSSYNFFNDYYNQSNSLDADTLLLGWNITKLLNKRKENSKYEKLIRENFPNSLELKQIINK